MFRARIALAAAVVVAALTAVVVTQVSAKINDATQKAVDERVGHARAAFPKLDLLRGIELTNETAKLARENEFADAFAKSGDDQRQAGAHAGTHLGAVRDDGDHAIGRDGDEHARIDHHAMRHLGGTGLIGGKRLP